MGKAFKSPVKKVKLFKSFVRSVVERAGYHVIAKSFFGHDAFADFKTLLAGNSKPCVVDVGGYIGEFAIAISQIAPGAIVHSFEADPETFQRLLAGTRHLSNVKPVNLALGPENG